MSSKVKIYTRTGDKGYTSLYSGKRVDKSVQRISVYGAIDELNSVIGIVISHLAKNDNIRTFLSLIQSDLLSIGAYLAGKKMEMKFMVQRVQEMENLIDHLDKKLPQLKNFILPQGTVESAFTHLARTVCRRVERETVRLSKEQKINSHVIIFLNRLSDVLFVTARYLNFRSGLTEIIWIKR